MLLTFHDTDLKLPLSRWLTVPVKEHHPDTNAHTGQGALLDLALGPTDQYHVCS